MLPVRADKHAMHRDPPPATVSLVPVTDGAASRVQPWWPATAASDATVSSRPLPGAMTASMAVIGGGVPHPSGMSLAGGWMLDGWRQCERRLEGGQPPNGHGLGCGPSIV
jgi:hypothetical protein